jgi:high affinity Mn2+ porin
MALVSKDEKPFMQTKPVPGSGRIWRHLKIVVLAALLFLCQNQGLADSGMPPGFQPDVGTNEAKAVLTTDAAHQPENWNVHGQATFIDQAHPPFHSPYAGNQSLGGAFQQKETMTAAAALALRLWPGAELYGDVGTAQGYGFNHAFGVASSPNGDTTRGGTGYPREYVTPCFKQVFGLGGAQQWMESGGNQLAGFQDVSRITVVAGGLCLPDYFDNNAYAHDPENDFSNWALWDGGAWDFAGDARGYTAGGIVELNQKDWALRYGIAVMPLVLNGSQVHFDDGRSLQHDLELEERYTVAGLSAKTRFLVFYANGFMGDYRDALRLNAAGEPINDAMQATRTPGHEKYGFVVNQEQALMDDLGGFARLSWNNGRCEDWGNTDMDRSLAAGLSMKGGSWGRKDDTIGIGCAASGISREHREFLAAGGDTLLLGDGQLPQYSLEKIGEFYYACKLSRAVTLSANYQLIDNPGFNRDRGPVDVFGLRLHAEF